MIHATIYEKLMHTIDFFHHFFGEIEHVVGTCDLFDAICLMKIHIFLSEQWEKREDEFDFSLETFIFFAPLHGEFATMWWPLVC